jgi:hypothetical protein
VGWEEPGVEGVAAPHITEATGILAHTGRHRVGGALCFVISAPPLSMHLVDTSQLQSLFPIGVHFPRACCSRSEAGAGQTLGVLGQQQVSSAKTFKFSSL